MDAGTPRSRRIIQLMEDARQLAVAARAWLIAGEIARNQCGQLAIEAGAATGPERAAAVGQVEEALQHAEACLASAKPWAPSMLYKHVLARIKEVRAESAAQPAVTRGCQACQPLSVRQPLSVSGS